MYSVMSMLILALWIVWLIYWWLGSLRTHAAHVTRGSSGGGWRSSAFQRASLALISHSRSATRSSCAASVGVAGFEFAKYPPVVEATAGSLPR